MARSVVMNAPDDRPFVRGLGKFRQVFAYLNAIGGSLNRKEGSSDSRFCIRLRIQAIQMA